MAEGFNKAELKYQIATVLKHSQGYDFDVNVDNLFKNWLAAKWDIIEALGGQLIYEYPTPVTFTLNQAYKDNILDSFIESVVNVYHNFSLANFIDQNKKGFFDNTVVASNDKATPVGMKLVKAFKHFVADKDVLYELQSKASQIIQEEKVHGILCLSVHPLDFLSSSENTYNWHSCHALDGEFRCGNLSYMQDSSTMLVYIKSNEELGKIPDFPKEVPWNSKKWRMLLYVSEQWDMLMAGRQYPFAIQGALDYIFKNVLMKTILVSNIIGEWSGWSDTVIKSVPIVINDKGDTIEYKMRGEKMIPGGSTLRPIEEVVRDCRNPLHFNDLLHSSCYTPFYNYKKYKNGEMIGGFPQFFIGHDVKCVCCGKEKVNMPSTFLCDACELEHGTENNDLCSTCECCGQRFYTDDGVWIGDDTLICPSCAENEATVCDNCGEIVLNKFIEYCASTDSYICQACARQIEEDKIYCGVSNLEFL